MNVKCFVGNLKFETTEGDLNDFFVELGYSPVSVKIMTDRDTGRSRGFGFVEFVDAETCQKAIKVSDGYELDGRTLSVSEARPVENRPARSQDSRRPAHARQ